MPPKKIEGATEAHAGSGAWFEKHVAENGTFECFGYPQPMRVGLHIVGHLKNQFDIVSLELVNRQDVGTAKIHWSTFLRCFLFNCEPCMQSTLFVDRERQRRAGRIITGLMRELRRR